MEKYILISLILGLLLISGCGITGNAVKESFAEIQNKTEYAEITASDFAKYWREGDITALYELFVSELKDKRSRNRFVKFFIASEKPSDIKLDKVDIDSENTAYAYYTLSGEILKIKLEYLNGWKVNAFENFFTDDCAEKCTEIKCKNYACNSGTGFRCEYYDVKKCNCNDDSDCPYYEPVCISGSCSVEQCSADFECNVTSENKDACESQGLNFEAWVECLNGKCIQHCKEHSFGYPVFYNSKEEADAKLKMRIFASGGELEIRNYDADLDNVIILLESSYKKEFDLIEAGDVLTVGLSEFMDEDGLSLRGVSSVDEIYLYCPEGKWWV